MVSMSDLLLFLLSIYNGNVSSNFELLCSHTNKIQMDPGHLAFYITSEVIYVFHHLPVQILPLSYETFTFLLSVTGKKKYLFNFILKHVSRNNTSLTKHPILQRKSY